MTTSLRSKAISGASWSLAGRILQEGFTFAIGILLARLLLPDQYGLIAMATVFIYFSYVFVDSGFGSALVQRKHCTQADFSTIFYVNLLISLVVFAFFYFLAPTIAVFYNEPELTRIVRVLAIIIVLYALSIVHLAIIRRDINFKLKTQIEFTSQVASGAIAVYLALKGYGVWALVWKVLLNQLFVNAQLWLRNHWLPSLEFSTQSLKEMFGFSSKLLISGVLDRGYQQIYRLVIGKFFPARELGLFTRADQFQKLPSQTISGSITSFSLPVFSKMQDEPVRLKNAVKQTLGVVMYFNLFAMILLGAVSRNLILVLLGAQWADAVVFLQILIGVGLLYPMQLINVQILTALGRSDLFLRIEIIKKLLTIPIILLGILIGIKAMLAGMVLGSIAGLYINTYYTGKLLQFGLVEQIKVIGKSIFISLLMGVIVFLIGYLAGAQIAVGWILLLQLVSSFVSIIVLSKIMNVTEYLEIKEILTDQIRSFLKRRK
ncbi:MAG: lipopolysaccharide biosynthesis protein [Sphaerochaetaceae bacterium]|nr:lipopolysaccharide biosynthesis protein [Sphaerochaetaceae bacterium]